MAHKVLNIALWAAQVLLVIMFGFVGFLKLTQPLDHLTPMMPWVPSFPPLFVRTVGALEMLGAVGIVLPALTRIKPGLTPVTAACFCTLQVLAIALHASRGETARSLPMIFPRISGRG